MNQITSNESECNYSGLEDLKKQLLKMDKYDRIHALWGVREKWTDETHKDRMVDYCMSIDKSGDKKYVICGVIDFRSHDLFWDALKESGVEKWYHFKDCAINLDYEDMCKVLDAMPKFFKDKKYVNGPRGIWHFISFDRNECEKECEKQVRPFIINLLENEIKHIEQGVKTLEAKKAKLAELKEAQANDDI